MYRNGGVEIIPNSNGEINTPSIVTVLSEDKILRGEETFNYYLEENYEESIYGIKRYIGRECDKRCLEEIKHEKFPFQIIENKNTRYPLISINKNNKIIQFTLEEILSFIIKEMIDNAEAYLNKKINKLVIAVPCNFNDSQKNSIKRAVELAEVNVIGIISEPVAAALAYNYTNIFFSSKINEQYEEKKYWFLI